MSRPALEPSARRREQSRHGDGARLEVQLSASEAARLDALRLPGESRSAAVRRLIAEAGPGGQDTPCPE